MKKFLLLIILAFGFTQDPPEIEWSQTFGENSGDAAYSTQQTSDGGYIITGYTGSFGNGSADVWLIKTDSQGIEEWNQTFRGINEETTIINTYNYCN